MKILIIAGIFPPDIGGPANYLPKIAESLRDRGHDVELICFSDKIDHPDNLTYQFPVHRILRKDSLIMREVKTLLLGIRLAKKSDVIFSNGNDFKAWIIGTITQKPRVHKIVGDTSWERAQNRKWTKLDLDSYQVSKKTFWLRLLDWVRKFPLQMSSAIITPSHYLKRIVTCWQINQDKIHVIYNSFEKLPISREVDPLFNKKNAPHWMVTVCRLVAWKGLHELIDQIAQHPNLGLIIVGDGPLENELKVKVQNSSAGNRVYFAGRQSRDRVQFYINQADFFILNSSYEGLPHVVLEAMACKKLVLASNVGGTPEVVKHQQTGLLFEYNHSQSINQCIQTALILDQQPIINQACEFIESNFSFERMADETELVLYRSISK